MTLAEFLTARFAEDEEVAREALFINPKLDGWYLGVTAPGDGAGGVHEAFAALTVGPGRILAECAAKRRIVEHAERVLASVEPWQDRTSTARLAGEARDMAHAAIALLALPYADHPDYRQEWAP